MINSDSQKNVRYGNVARRRIDDNIVTDIILQKDPLLWDEVYTQTLVAIRFVCTRVVVML
jgi:hypothetical protein